MIDEHRTFLNAHAITDEVIEEYGVLSVTGPDGIPDEIYATWHGFLGEAEKGILFFWPVSGREPVPQYRPDEPIETPDGKTHKYLLPKGCGSFVAVFREPSGDAPMLVTEGTKQTHAALSWAPPEWGIAGVPGCNNWSGTDLSWADGRKVIVLFDADFTTNRNVYDAAAGLKEALEVEDADEVAFARLAGAQAKEGLDDVLRRRPEDRRRSYLEKIAERATDKLGRQPARKKTGAEAEFFDDSGKLLALTLANKAMSDHPAALTAAGDIAMYQPGGVFKIDRLAFGSVISEFLGETHRPNHLASAKQVAEGRLYAEGKIIPDRVAEPLLNCKNGMLNLMTLELLPHDPKYLSRSQSPVEWIEDATCPHYEKWLTEQLPDQMDDLEESTSMMLDQSRTPSKAIFNYGPSKSGKSTFLRIMEAIAGSDNVSGVTLHELSDDRFAAAGVYGMSLNSCAELSPKDISNLDTFKKLTGDDLVEAQFKYGQRFKFRNSALFAFSANVIPSVSESSKAYTNRIKPFRWSNSFEGREDPEIEDRIMTELPGILARWVRAWRQITERGKYLPTTPDVMAEFAKSSDRVNRWISLYCTVTPTAGRSTLPPTEASTQTELSKAFNVIQELTGGVTMGRETFGEKLRNVPGVNGVKLTNRGDGYNVVFHGTTAEDDGDPDAMSGIRGKGIKIVVRSERSSHTRCMSDTQQEKSAAEEKSQTYREGRSKTAQTTQRSSVNGSGPADAVPEWAPGHYKEGSVVRCLGKTYRAKSDTLFAPTYDGWTEQS